MAKLTKRRNSTTSVGRFILDVIKPTPALTSLGKRERGNDSSEYDTTRVSESSTAQAHDAPRSSHHACVALQNEDLTEDAVVITALNTIPFCCHADLVTMSRLQLLAVADILNAKLPLAMQIDTGSSRTDTWIRHSIEFLVGIRESMPDSPADPLTRSHTRGVTSLDNGTPATPRSGRGRNVSASPMSPLASRGRPNMSFGTPSLAVLREDSGEGHPEAPPQKRRRTENVLPFEPARPITRAQGRRVSPLLVKAESAPRAIGAAAGARILRSRSVPNPPVGQPRAPTGGTPRRSARTRAGHVTKSHTFAMTSTPKKRAAAAVNSPAAGGQRTRSLLAEVQNINMTARGYRGGATPGKKGKACEDSADVEDITFGLDGFTMPMISKQSFQYSDMELCTD